MIAATAAMLTICVPIVAANEVDDLFERDIRPLLISKCSECHTGSQRSGGLSLSSRKSLLAGGDSGPAINLAEPTTSLLLQAVIRSDEIAMPPDHPLSEHEIAALKTWIMLGAPWPENSSILSSTELRTRHHWAFQSVNVPSVPEVNNVGWVRNPIDAFVLARLEAAGMTPSPEADRRTLARRTSYTLTGLPPSTARLTEFTMSNAKADYAKLVDELLDSPQYGEHGARHWLDLARYSDTKGYVYAREERFWIHAWVYRDWVVQALNRDLAYDEFLRLQIAADQIENRREDDLAALGFLTLGRRFLGVPWDIIDDRIDTVCRSTMALTVACARCHDHKYDPLPTADYYSLYGVFASSQEEIVRLPSSMATVAYETEFANRQMALTNKLNTSREEASIRARTRVRDYLQAQLELDKYPAQGFDQIFEKDDLLPATVRRWQAWLHQSKRAGEPVFVPWHRFHELSAEDFAQQAASICRELHDLPDEQLNPRVRAVFQEPPASMVEVVERYAKLLSAVDDEWQELLQEAGDSIPIGLSDAAAEQLRQVLYGPLAPCEVPNQPLVHVEAFFDSGTVNELWNLQGEVDRWIITSPEAVPHALLLKDAEVPFEPRILRRGNPVNYGDDVPRQFIEFLSGPNRQPFQQGSGRLELAQAITSPDNPLTARVIVNRVWTQHFGQGLVTTPSDFGLRATSPSHPELLDWLAHWFVQEGWSLKRLHRLILTSNTYRQRSDVSDAHPHVQAAHRIDPENRLLWRMNRHRLTFEEFRDSLLTAAGNLDPSVGGRPVNMFSPPFPQRRTLYGLVDRQFLPSTLRVFDFANPDLHVPQRSETTVPQQALFMLNHPLVLEQVRTIGRKAEQANDPALAITEMFRQVLQRTPETTELEDAKEFINTSGAWQAEPAPVTIADWHYGYGAYDEGQQQTSTFTLLPHFTGTAWQGGTAWPDAGLGWVQLTAEGGHPGNDRQHASIRRWVAPRAATVAITSSLQNEPAAGDGIRAFIVSSRAGTLQAVKNHQTLMTVNVDTLTVEAGETLDFIVDIDAELNSDQFEWEITIHDVQHQTIWNSRADFPRDHIRELSPWEQLAQTLLCTNEFLFVD